MMEQTAYTTIQQAFIETSRSILQATSSLDAYHATIREQVRDILAAAGSNGAGLVSFINQWANDIFPADRFHTKKDASPFAKAGYNEYRYIQKCFKDLGTEGDGTHYSFDFRTKGGKRDVTVTISTAAERAIVDKVEKERAALEAQAAEQLSTVRQLAERDEKSKLTDGDVAAQMAEYFHKMYGDTHNAATVAAAWSMAENIDVTDEVA